MAGCPATNVLLAAPIVDERTATIARSFARVSFWLLTGLAFVSGDAQAAEPQPLVNPYRNAQPGDWVEYRSVLKLGATQHSSTIRRQVVSVADDSVLLKSIVTEEDGSERITEHRIDLKMPFKPVELLGLAEEEAATKGEVELVETLKAKIDINGVSENARLLKYQVSDPGAPAAKYQVWTSEKVPLDGMAKRTEQISSTLLGDTQVEITLTTFAFAARKSSDDLASAQPMQGDPGQPAKWNNSLGMTMVDLPAGEFDMGSLPIEEFVRRGENGTLEDRLELIMQDPPIRRQTIDKAFAISSCEVTIGQFKQFVEETDYETECQRDGRGGTGRSADGEWGVGAKFNWKKYGFETTDSHPVANVTWNDATEFCKWLSKKDGKTYRLPSEAEWEYACRAGTTTKYCTGDDPTKLEGFANLADQSLAEETPGLPWALPHNDGHPFLAPVGTYKPNNWGLCDMHGNVLEWCGTRFSALDPLPEAKPPGPAPEKYTLRGGHWFGPPMQSTSACRSGSEPSLRMALIGFRVVAEK